MFALQVGKYTCMLWTHRRTDIIDAMLIHHIRGLAVNPDAKISTSFIGMVLVSMQMWQTYYVITVGVYILCRR